MTTKELLNEELLTEELVGLDEMILKIKSNESLINEAKKENEKFKGSIKKMFLERGIEKTRTEHFSVIVKEVSSKKFDPKRFKKEHLDIYNLYLKESSSINLYID